MPNPARNLTDIVNQKIKKIDNLVKDANTTFEDLDLALDEYFDGLGDYGWHDIFRSEMRKGLEWSKRKVQYEIEKQQDEKLKQLDDIDKQQDEKIESIRIEMEKFKQEIEEFKLELKKEMDLHNEKLRQHVNESIKRCEDLFEKHEKNDDEYESINIHSKEIITINEIKSVQEQLIAQKTFSESLQHMFFELLKIIENLLSKDNVQNRDYSVDKPMEEVKSEPSRLGFF